MSEYIIKLADNDAPSMTTAEEIVRCRDCERYVRANPATGWNDVCDATDSKVQPDGYCAWGERKEGGDD